MAYWSSKSSVQKGLPKCKKNDENPCESPEQELLPLILSRSLSLFLHTHTHVFIHMYMCKCLCEYTHTCIHTGIHTFMHAYMYTNAHMYTWTNTHTCPYKPAIGDGRGVSISGSQERGGRCLMCNRCVTAV